MNIKLTRQLLGLSVAKFAEKVEVTANTVRRWEMNPERAGHRNPDRYSQMLIQKLVDEARL